MNFYEKVSSLQVRLKAPKNQFNSFGKYKYRSCEDITEAVKVLNQELGLILLLTDDLVLIGERYYIKATATLTDGENSLSVNGYARESENKKGMDSSQLTGSTSSYARKYALNGLLSIDDTKDSDSTNTHGKTETKKETKAPTKKVELAQSKIKALYTLAGKKGYDSEGVKKIIKSKYKIDSTKELSLEQFTIMIKGFEGMKDKESDK